MDDDVSSSSANSTACLSSASKPCVCREYDNNSVKCTFPLMKRKSPYKRKDKVFIGCGAGFGGDRPMAARKLLQRVDLDYIVLECLAERTLADRYNEREAGGEGYDPRLEEWMRLLLPLAVAKGTCIITNMGAVDTRGAREKVLEIASSQGISINVGMAHHIVTSVSALELLEKDGINVDRSAVYLGAAPIVQCLETCKPDVVITSRVADAALFLAPMVYELGWDWNECELVAQGTMAGHLLECGCQLTGGYFMHPGDKFRDMPLPSLLDLSLPYAEVTSDGQVCVAKAEGSGGVLSVSTCCQQLLYEVGDPGAYITPDLIVDFRNVTFKQLSSSKVLCCGAEPAEALVVPDKLLLLASKDVGWKGWGEISYGGHQCVQRAKAAEYLVRAWMEEVNPGNNDRIMSYIIGLDSIKATDFENDVTLSTNIKDIRLRMDGLFEHKEHAIQFTKEFTALYTNGPAGGGGITTGYKKEIVLEKAFIKREDVYVHVGSKKNDVMDSDFQSTSIRENEETICSSKKMKLNSCVEFSFPQINSSPAEAGQKIPLYKVAHSRAGDKGNDLNFSIIPHFLPDINRLKVVITPAWVKSVVASLLNTCSFPDTEAIRKRDEWVSKNVKVEIYEVRGISSLNVVVRNILDGGVNCSRRIDRHGKSISDIILSQLIVLPP